MGLIVNAAWKCRLKQNLKITMKVQLGARSSNDLSNIFNCAEEFGVLKPDFRQLDTNKNHEQSTAALSSTCYWQVSTTIIIIMIVIIIIQVN